MPSLIDFRRRIRSVKNTQQITKAMKMVSAAKLRRAQDAVIAARPFANSLRQMLANVAHAAKGSEGAAENPLLAERPEDRVLVLVINSDRGLAGAFSTNINKGAHKFLTEGKAGKKWEVEAVGKKARDYFRRRGFTIAGETFNVTKSPLMASDPPEYRAAWDLYGRAPVKKAGDVLERIQKARKAWDEDHAKASKCAGKCCPQAHRQATGQAGRQ